MQFEPLIVKSFCNLQPYLRQNIIEHALGSDNTIEISLDTTTSFLSLAGALYIDKTLSCAPTKLFLQNHFSISMTTEAVVGSFADLKKLKRFLNTAFSGASTTPVPGLARIAHLFKKEAKFVITLRFDLDQAVVFEDVRISVFPLIIATISLESSMRLVIVLRAAGKESQRTFTLKDLRQAAHNEL